MNIFLFDEDLKKNAEYFKDRDPKRFNKQIVESAQLMAASMKHHHNIIMYKKDGTEYTVNRILNHPACKWLLVDINNHYWHIKYLQHLLVLSPNHSCNKTVLDAKSELGFVPMLDFMKSPDPKEYLCITNSDMSGLEDPTVFKKYIRHLDNKHKQIVT